MPNVAELKKIYDTLDQEQKTIVIDWLAEALQNHEDAKAKVFDSVSATQMIKVALLKDSFELRQLIFAATNQKTFLRSISKCDDQEFWQSIEKFFEI